MNVILVLRALPKATPMEYNQAVIASYSEPTMGDVNLVAEVITTDMRVPDGSAVFGFANELGVITQIASINDVAGIFGFETSEIGRELRDTMTGLVGALA